MFPERDRPEIEITEEMIEAGEAALSAYEGVMPYAASFGRQIVVSILSASLAGQVRSNATAEVD